MSLVRVSVTSVVSTFCPNLDGGQDESAVTITWSPEARVNAEDLHALIEKFTDWQVYAEDLAEAVAERLWDEYGWPATVVVRQLTGHGVEAEAKCP